MTSWRRGGVGGVTVDEPNLNRLFFNFFIFYLISFFVAVDQ